MSAPKRRSGKIFFVTVLFLIVSIITATLLLANDRRNLMVILARFGYRPPPSATQIVAPNKTKGPAAAMKGSRLRAPILTLPAHILADLKSPAQHVRRVILIEPTSLCRALAESGFSGMRWTASSVSPGNWECASTITLPATLPVAGAIPATIVTPAAPGTGEDETAASSVFVYVKGDAQDRMTSFRVKLNIENPADTGRVVNLATAAVALFLKQVRWEQAEDVVRRMRALAPFDLRSFGSRLQFKKERGETPRYNFQAGRASGLSFERRQEGFFEPGLWLPLPPTARVPEKTVDPSTERLP